MALGYRSVLSQTIRNKAISLGKDTHAFQVTRTLFRTPFHMGDRIRSLIIGMDVDSIYTSVVGDIVQARTQRCGLFTPCTGGEVLLNHTGRLGRAVLVPSNNQVCPYVLATCRKLTHASTIFCLNLLLKKILKRKL